MYAALRHLDQTPERPGTPIPPPSMVVTATVEIDGAQPANPVAAVSRLLSSEAEAFARVHGDDRRLTIEVALADVDPRTVDHAGRWLRSVVHNAGVRGITTIGPPTSRTIGPDHLGPLPAIPDEVAQGKTTIVLEPGWPGQELGLSERESQVVDLVADGLTNSEIGDRLYLSSETVKTHLRRAFMKLGCRNRAHAAAFVTRSPTFTHRPSRG